MRITSLRQAVTAVLLASAATVQAVQPSAPKPQQARLRDLPWSKQLNFLHTTDTHGWHAGHLQEASYSADWGDYISFAHHLRKKADEEGSDLLLVDTGDKVEGNGLYDSSEPKGKYTYPIYKGAEVDILTCGNHELYKQNTSEAEYNQIIPAYKDNYISSNIDIIDPKTKERVPLAQRFRKFTTKNQGIRIMAFGFLFDFKGSSDHAFVQPVKDAIKEKWFQDAIRDREVDLFVVAAHAALRGTELNLIYDAIRKQRWDAPIQFFGGHLHIRDYVKFDNKAYGLASGRYHETIGFQSISGLSTKDKKEVDAEASPTFARRYIDNNLFSLQHHSGQDKKSFTISEGKNVSVSITAARAELNLDQRFGCAPKDLWTNRVPYPGEGSEDSAFTWLESEVLPEMAVDKNRTSQARIVIANTGTMRFDVFKGAFTRDTTFIIQPFTNGFRYLKDVPFALADKLLRVLNNGGNILDELTAQNLQNQMLLPLQQVGRNMLPTQAKLSVSQGASRPGTYGTKMQKVFAVSDKPESKEPALSPGYTTVDDAGTDGDDTVHSAIEFFNVPNVFEARINTTDEDGNHPEAVDLIFLDFVQPWILAGLKFLGGGYSVNDTAPYAAEMDFTTMISTWVSRHWNETDC